MYIPGEFWDEKNQCYYGDTNSSQGYDSEELFLNKDYYDDELEEDIKNKEEKKEGEMEDNKNENVENYNDNENILNNSFENFHMFCKEHISNEIIGLCIDNNCKKNKLMCTDCIFQYHVKHDMVRIKDVIKQYNNFTQKIDYIKYKLKPMFIRKKEEIKMKINKIIDNQFKKCLKIKEMNDYLKIKQNLKSINTIYQNPSMLKNEQELSNSMFNFCKSYSQENNEQDELISKIENKLNQNIEKYIKSIEKKLLNIN